jgi:hypothetical protein
MRMLLQPSKQLHHAAGPAMPEDWRVFDAP